MNEVSFRQGLQSEWQSLYDAGNLDQNCLYFCIDSHNIYKGSIFFGTSRIENITQEEDKVIEIYGGNASDNFGEDN